MSGEHANGQLFHRCIPWGYLFCRFASILALPIFESFALLVLRWDYQILTHGLGWCTQAVRSPPKQRAITVPIWTIILWGEPTGIASKKCPFQPFIGFSIQVQFICLGPASFLGQASLQAASKFGFQSSWKHWISQSSTLILWSTCQLRRPLAANWEPWLGPPGSG